MPKTKEKTTQTKDSKEPKQEEKVKKGDFIKVHYTGTFDDGTVFDSSEKRGEPLAFQTGSKQLIKGFDDAVMGMKEGDEKNIKLNPSEAYGDPNPELIKKVPRERLPPEPEPKIGMMLILSSPQGMQLPAKITAVDEKEITIDLNHPLAGKTLNFTIKLLEISKDASSCCGHDHGDCHDCH